MIPKGLLKKIEKKNIPLLAQLELTYRCNLKCAHCFLSTQAPEEKVEELGTEKIKDILGQLAQAGSFYLTLTGGEIFLRDDIFEIISFAHKNNFAISLLTNGTLITSRIADKLAKFPLVRVQISILGATPKTHDSITQTKGSFEAAMKGIRLLKEKGVNVIIATILMKQNFSEYMRLKELIKDLGIDDLSFVPIIRPKNIGDKTPVSFRINDAQMRAFYKDTFDESIEAEESVKKREFSLICRAGIIGVSISPKGEVLGCSGLPKAPGNLNEKSFLELWNSPDYFWQRIRNITEKELKGCSDCSLSNICFRCAGMAYLEDGDAFGSSQEACRIAKIIKEVLDEKEKAKV